MLTIKYFVPYDTARSREKFTLIHTVDKAKFSDTWIIPLYINEKTVVLLTCPLLIYISK